MGDTINAIEANSVSFAYRTGVFSNSASPLALKAVSLSVAYGESHGLVGESGSGKSTLGRLVLGFLKPISGSIETCGVVAHALRGKQQLAFRRMAQIVYQDSSSALNPRMTLGRSAAEGLEIHGWEKEAINRELHRLFELTGLPLALKERYPHEVSGGQRQRVCIARALALNPQLLVADEPVTALDVSVQTRIIDLFASLKKELGLTLLFISHDLNVVREISSQVSVMHRGQIIENGATDDVFSRPVNDYTRLLLDSIPGGPLT